MDKQVLIDYIDACAFIAETEKELRKLKKKRKVVIDKVRGSNPEFPYQPRSFGIAGTTSTYEHEDLIRNEEHILEVQKETAEDLKQQVEEWLEEIPFRMRRIIRYKFFNGLSWNETAALMKARSGESVRKEFQRFMGQN